jgi:hypothetical protein
MNRNLAGFYHDPPLWVGSVPTGMDQDPPQDLSQFTQFSETASSRTIAGTIKFQVSREGLFSFDFSNWTPGQFPEHSDNTPLAFERSAELMLNQASVMNAFLGFFYSNELNTAHFARQCMVVTPELRLPLDSLDGNSGMGFGNQSVAHLAMSRFASSYRPGLPIMMDGRICFRGAPVGTDIIDQALTDLDTVIRSEDKDGLGLLELFLRSGKSYQDHNHALAVINYWAIIERLLQELWTNYQKINEQRDGEVFISGGRKKRLNDGRTFTAAVITETLSFGGLLPLDLYTKLNRVRKIRNDWMHGTKLGVTGPEARVATEACEGMFKLVRSIDVKGSQSLQLHG